MIIITFPENLAQAAALAEQLSIPCLKIDLHHFPDGESKLVLPPEHDEHVLLFRTLDHPNEKLLELFLVASALKEQGVKRLTLVAPYLCYMRQDIAFHPGEIVSQKVLGRMLANFFDDLITVDPHLHRISRLNEAIPIDHAITLTATGPFGQYLSTRNDKPLLLGPDEESRQWVESIARLSGLDFGVASKLRRGDREVVISLPELPLAGRNIVLVDDVASTAETLIVAAEELRQVGVTKISVLVTHALFVGDALQKLRGVGVEDIASSDSVPHPTNVVQLAPIIADAIRQL